jgi:nitrogen fixation NifU-like protein
MSSPETSIRVDCGVCASQTFLGENLFVDSIYRENILEHSKHPQNKGHLDPYDFAFEDTNPLCGDEVRIELRVNDEGVVTDVAFSGQGCAISQASASMLTEIVHGMTVDEVKSMPKEELLDEVGIELSPARLKCALLSLNVLKASLYGKDVEEAVGNR